MFYIHDCTKSILAKEKMLTMDTRQSRLNNNVMLVGATGRGKTRNIIKPNIMQMNSSYVISDPKGQLVLELGNMLELYGYKVKVLNLIDMTHSNTYNPFYYVKSDSDIYKMIDYVLLNINPYFGMGKDPFWDNAAKALLASICFYLHYECRMADRNFTSVLKLLRCLEVSDDPQYESTLDIMFRVLKEKDPEHIAVKQYAVFKASSGSPRTAASIAVSTAVPMQWFNLSEYECLTSSDNIGMEDIGREKTALFVITSDTDRSKNWLAGVFYSQLFDVLCNMADTKCKEGRLPVHVRFILDDFACTARIPDFDYKLAMIRSREISCMVAIQDEAQLLKEYGLAAKGIIANCDSYIFLGSSNIDSCDMVARRLGDSEITGTDIRSMDYSECVVICGNEGGIYEKYDIKQHPMYDLIADTADAARYDLPRKYSIKTFATTPLKDIRIRKGQSIILKESLFDSFEEAYLYSIISRISNITVHLHQQLRDVFTAKDTPTSVKLSYMHCDFIVRDNDWNVLFGIEIDGNQHRYDQDQLADDSIKNNFFAINSVPLLRFTTEEVREDIRSVVAKILVKASDLDDAEHTLKGEIPEFDLDQKYKMNRRDWVKCLQGKK